MAKKIKSAAEKLPFQRKVIQKMGYERGLYLHQCGGRDQVADWALNEDVYMEVVENGTFEDGKEFVVLRFHNTYPISEVPETLRKARRKITFI